MAIFSIIIGLSILIWGWFLKREEAERELLEEEEDKLVIRLSEAKEIREDLSRLLTTVTQTGERLIEDIEKRLYEARELIEALEVKATHQKSNKQPLKAAEVPGGSTPDLAQVPAERGDRVRSLAKRGLTVDEIAQSLNMGKGEVELYLNLERNRC